MSQCCFIIYAKVWMHMNSLYKVNKLSDLTLFTVLILLIALDLEHLRRQVIEACCLGTCSVCQS